MSDIKSTPTPGFRYTVQSGDWISRIAERAYGDPSKWTIIRDANLRDVEGPDKETGGDQVWFFPGDIIFIPELAELRKKKVKKTLPNKGKEEITLIVEDTEIPVQTARIIRTMDTAADGASITVAWEPFKDPKIDELLAFYGYREAQVYIGGELIITGVLYNVENRSSKTGRSKTLEIFSFTADIIDSTVRLPYEQNNVTLLQRCKKQCEPFGIDVIVDDGTDIGGQIKRATAEPTDTIFEHLAKLASEKGVLLSSTVEGDLLITTAKTDQETVGTIEEGLPQAQEFSIKADGRQRFSNYKAISQTPKKTDAGGTATDNVVSRPRFLTFNASDSLSGETKNAARWKKNKTLADALTIPFPVTSWYNPKDKLWTENTTVTIKSPTIGIQKGFTFLIKQVEFIQESAGKTAVLSIVPPQVYTEEDVEEPWIL